jgi:general secretion pathway protein D
LAAGPLRPAGFVCLVACLLASLSGCYNRVSPVTPSQGHITVPPPPAGEILPPVRSSAFALPPPKPVVKAPTYSVVVNEVPVKELLLALARDTRQNIDIHPALSGVVSVNAINETLPAILERISKQVSMRYRRDGNTITVQPDTPFLKTYRVNYVNMQRGSEWQIGVSGTITGAATGGAAGSQGVSQSQVSVTTRTQNQFWELLRDNIRAILVSTQALAQSAEERASYQESMRFAREERIAQAEAVARAGAAAPALIDKVFQATPPASAAAMPPSAITVCALPSRLLEMIPVFIPCALHSIAALRPAPPAPMTRTSCSIVWISPTFIGYPQVFQSWITPIETRRT